MVKMLVEKYNAKCDCCDFVSMYKCYKSWLIMIIIIIMLIDLNFLQGGYQPLHLAATNNHIDVIEYLVKECNASVEPEAMVYCSTKQCSLKKHKNV